MLMAIDVKGAPTPRELTVSRSRAWDWLTQKRSKPDDSLRPVEGPPKFPDLQGVVTDQRLLTELSKVKGEEVYPIATDTFLDKSKDQYNSAWLTRELVQNFVDHNAAQQGTLNGVRFGVEVLPTGVKRITIQGEWPFQDPTGVISPHSEKPEGVNTAGGNGIGLKQTAIRLLRDFGVERFEIQGENWTVNYNLAKKEAVNRELAERGSAQLVRHDWLVGHLKQTEQKGRSGYVIETNNPTLIQALEQFNTLGVSNENPYLQNPDYVSEAGAIKWMPKTESGEIARGRMFINGQVMNYGVNGPSELDYWVGPEGVTVQLNNTAYAMNIDRPPVEPWRLKQYIGKLVEGMSKEALVEQLGKSENLWAGSVGGSLFSRDTPGCFVVIESIVDKLATPSVGLKPEDISQAFGKKKILALDTKLDEGQIRNLETQGYTICPGFFAKIGFEKASSKLESVDLASTQSPDISPYSRSTLAEKFGVQVAFEPFEAKTAEEFFTGIGDRLKPIVTKVEGREGRPATIRLELPSGAISRELLSNPLFNPKNESQKLLYFLRGVAFHGLQKYLFDKIFLSQGEAVTTFKTDYDPSSEDEVLFVRNNKGESSTPFIEIDFKGDLASKFMEIYSRPDQVEQVSVGAVEGGVVKKTAASEPAGTLDTSGRTIETPIPGGTPAPSIDVVKPEVVKLSEAKPEQAQDTVGPTNTVPWSEDDQRIWQIARGKRQEDYTEEERGVMRKHEDLARRVAEIGIAQSEGPERTMGGGVVEKPVSLSDAEKERLAKLEKAIPGIAGLVEELESNVPRQKIEDSPNKSEHEKYLEWRQSPDFYGRLGQEADYLSGRTLVDILNENSQAVINVVKPVSESDPSISALSLLQQRLKSVVDRLVPEGDEVDDFELVLKPNERELAQLGLLKTFVEVSTGVRVYNDLFLYEGTGTKGINLSKKAIGLHKALTKTNFTEALGTFGHEVAHNTPGAVDHDVEWAKAMEGVFTTTIGKVLEVANKGSFGDELTQEERVLLDISNQWERLRAA